MEMESLNVISETCCIAEYWRRRRIITVMGGSGIGELV